MGQNLAEFFSWTTFFEFFSWLSFFESVQKKACANVADNVICICRGKNKKEKLAGILSSFQKTGDELLLSNTQKDVDNFFETEKTFLVQYHGNLKDATIR